MRKIFCDSCKNADITGREIYISIFSMKNEINPQNKCLCQNCYDAVMTVLEGGNEDNGKK